MSISRHIILASASPRRRTLLEQLGVPFTVVVTDLDESLDRDEQPAAYAERLARDKARQGWALANGESPALGADTIVVLGGEILLKPDSRTAAVSMLSRLSGQRHTVVSAVALAVEDSTIRSAVNRTEVSFAAIPPAWIEAYCSTDEPHDKAGAYAVQGRAARFIRRIDGSFSGVMGLPLFETARLLEWAGVLHD